MKQQDLKSILATLDKASKAFSRKHFVAGGDSMATAGTSPTSPTASEPQGGTEDLFRELQPAGPLTSNEVKYGIFHLPEEDRGKNGAPGNARGNPAVHSRSLSLARLGRTGSSPQEKQHKTYPCVNLFPAHRQTAIFLLVAPLLLNVEKVRKWAVFLKCYSDAFPKVFSVGTAGLEGSGFLLLFRMFHFTLNLEPGLRPQKSCFGTTEENSLHSLLLFCKNRKLKAVLVAACGAAASQWSLAKVCSRLTDQHGYYHR